MSVELSDVIAHGEFHHQKVASLEKCEPIMSNMESRARLFDVICGWAEISDLIQRSQPTLGSLLLIHLQVGELQYDLSSRGNLLAQFVAVECPKESEDRNIMYINKYTYILYILDNYINIRIHRNTISIQVSSR